MEHLVVYFKGLGFMCGMVVWVVFFNYCWYKLTKEELDFFGAWVMPFVVPLAIVGLLALPYIIGAELFK